MPRVLIAGAQQEISSFNPVICDYDFFTKTWGGEILKQNRGQNTEVGGAIEALEKVPGMELVLDKAGAAERFELPPDRLGDLVLVSVRDHTLGTSPDRHDLSGLTEPLRSHGGISEQRVPLIMNRQTDLAEGHALRNFDAFDLALNHAV